LLFELFLSVRTLNVYLTTCFKQSGQAEGERRWQLVVIAVEAEKLIVVIAAVLVVHLLTHIVTIVVQLVRKNAHNATAQGK
jgi:hypothetical protein